MRIFVSAGEPSGDLHGSNLIRELRARRPDVQCVGFGGPKMAAAGCELLFELTRLAVMGFGPVLRQIGTFWRLLWQADRYLRDERPDAVVMIDYPGFHWWLARRAKARGIPVFYYGAPQLWAWAPWRVRKMRRLVDHVLCKLPFEPSWYAERGCQATYVGHPYFDELVRRPLDETFLEEQRARGGRLVLVLPGSRRQEVRDNLRDLLKAARRAQFSVPDVRIAIGSYDEGQAATARDEARAQGVAAEVHVGRTLELMKASEVCLACSGSVSLELMYFRRPTVILYRVPEWMLRVQRWTRLLRVKYITLVNLLATDDIRATSGRPYDPDEPGAERAPFPEYLTSQDKSTEMAAHLVRWLVDPWEHRRRTARLDELAERTAHPGASARAAEYMLEALGETASADPVRRACA